MDFCPLYFLNHESVWAYNHSIPKKIVSLHREFKNNQYDIKRRNIRNIY